MQLWEAASTREVSPSSMATVSTAEIEIETASRMAAMCGSERDVISISFDLA
jgi:hypothetical protein